MLLAGREEDAPVKDPRYADFPERYPGWAQELGRVYTAGTSSTFVLHGNIDDLFRVETGQGGADYVGLKEFLAEQVFGSWDVVLGYDLARPPRALAGRSPTRLQAMNAQIDRHLGQLQRLPRDPTQALQLIDRYLELMLVSEKGNKRPKIAVVLDYAQLLFPRLPPAHIPHAVAANLVTLLNWARSPYFKQVNFAFVLLTERLSDLNEALAQSAHVQRIELAFPTEPERLGFAEWSRGNDDFSRLCVVPAELLAKMTAGLSLVNLRGLFQSARRHDQPVSLGRLKSYKKEMIEAACQGLVEFIEPEHSLEMVVGHEAAKQRLLDDARLIAESHLDAIPMGYLVSGPIGTGKSFLAQCYAGSVGIPCLRLLNFRSKYVGETEGNLEKILKVLRVMGPVLVMIDEADAALGDREQEGDSGTSSRVFAQIAAQMGDTSYRGRIIWFLMTARPDLLPVDIKRQGRAEVHIALFYPEGRDELRQMFVAMGRKNGVVVNAHEVPDIGPVKLSGADVEGIVTRARRLALLAGRAQVGAQDLRLALERFIPSAADAEKALQELAAVLECTDLEMLPEERRRQVRTPEGKAALLEELETLRRRLASR